MSALEGKQDVLQSGVNIKTVNGQSVMGGGNLEISEREYSYDLTDLEEQLKQDAISALNIDNPIIPQTGKRKFFSFGFLTDLHTALTQQEVQEDDTIPQNIKEQWPNFTTTGGGRYPGRTCEPTLKVLGAFANDVNLDAVICGGDFSSGALPYDCYQFMLEKVSQMFEKYISVPYFTVDGNHDRQYSSDVARRTNKDWLSFLKQFNHPRNLSLTYIGGDDEDEPSNCAIIDIADKKLRIVLRSQYEVSSTSYHDGGGYLSKSKSAFFANTNEQKDWSLLYVAHTGANSSYGLYEPAIATGGTTALPIGDYVGRGSIGEIRGHNHSSSHGMIPRATGVAVIGGTAQGKVPLNFRRINVAEAFTMKNATYNTSDYCFSIITVDTDEKRIIERKIGRLTHNSESTEDNNSMYVGYYAYLEDLSNKTIECSNIGNNQYQLSISGIGNKKPWVVWGISNSSNYTEYVSLNTLTGVLTVKDTLLEQKTIPITATSATDTNGNIVVGPFVEQETTIES